MYWYRALCFHPPNWSPLSQLWQSPAGVGFSDSTDEADYTTGDGQTTEDAHLFMLKYAVIRRVVDASCGHDHAHAGCRIPVTALSAIGRKCLSG
jgi:hypothetical protein